MPKIKYNISKIEVNAVTRCVFLDSELAIINYCLNV